MRFLILLFICPVLLLAQNTPDDHPVLLIPGIGGSVMQVGDREIPDQIAWVGGFKLNVRDAGYTPPPGVQCSRAFSLFLGRYKLCYELSGGDANFRNNLLGYYNASTGSITRAFGDQDTPIVPMQADLCGLGQSDAVAANQLCGISYLLSAGSKGLSEEIADILFYALDGELGTPIDYYGPMVAQLQSDYGFEPGRSLFGFPYDWRLSNIDNASLLAGRVDEICTRTGKKLNLIAHSMGNLLTMAFLSQFPDLAERCIESWVAIGAPFLGAGGLFYQATVEGYNFGDLLVCDCTSRPFSVQAPSVFELMPSPAYASQNATMIPFLSYQSLNGTVTIDERAEAQQFLTAAYANFPFCNDGEEHLFELNPESFESGVTFQDQILPRLANMTLPTVYIAYGTELPTINGVNYTTAVSTPQELIANCGATNCGDDTCVWPSCNDPQNPSTAHCTKNITFVDGDGTVPSLSAQTPPFNINASQLLAVPGVEHLDLVKDKALITHIFSVWLGYSAEAPSDRKAGHHKQYRP